MNDPVRQSSPHRSRVLQGIFGVLLLPSILLAGADESDDAPSDMQVEIKGQIRTEAGSTLPAATLQVWTFKDEPLRHWEPMEPPTIDQDGAFLIEELEAPASLLFRATANDMASGWTISHISEGETTETTIVMSPPGQVTLRVVDESEQPITDAYVRWMKIEGPNGSVGLPSHTFRDLDMSPPTSDGEGLLQIDDLPLSAKLTVGLLHTDHAPAEVKGVTIVEEAETSTVVMPDGIPLKIHVLSEGLDEPIKEVTSYLRHQPYDHPSSLVFEQIPLDSSGRATLMIEPGSYHMLRFTHPKALIGPVFVGEHGKQKFLEFSADTPTLTFHAAPMAEVRGRVISEATGEPVQEGYLIGQSLNLPADGPFAGYVSDWRFSDMVQTDSEGRYFMKLAVGPAKISFRRQGYATRTTYKKFEVSANGVTEAPEMELFPIKPVRGHVVDPEGNPIENAIVRFRGERLRWTQPVMTDGEGQFELKVPYIPEDDETDELVVQHPVVAFHLQQPWVGIAEVHLDQPDQIENLEIALQPTEDWNLTHLFEDELTPHEQGHIREEERAELESMSLVGKPAPELDGRQWLNTSQQQMSLADFRGKYVLLDFWTTWCGPCKGDLPSLNLLQETYGGEHFTILGVHDNSVDPDKIVEHVEKHGMENPVVIDHSDGRILREYGAHGISSYPSYLLIGPDGKVLIENRTAGGPSLRVYKLEIVRQYLMEHLEAK